MQPEAPALLWDAPRAAGLIALVWEVATARVPSLATTLDAMRSPPPGGSVGSSPVE